ncbi:unnamed protein product [Calypogeia fissa]
MSLNYKENSLVIPKLDGSEDFDAWQDLISGSLASAGGWKFVENTAEPPTREADEKQYQFQARLEAYHAQAAHARMIIITSCKPHIQTTLAKIPTAIEQFYISTPLIRIGRRSATSKRYE